MKKGRGNSAVQHAVGEGPGGGRERERERRREGGSKEGIGPQVEEERISWVHRGPWLMTLLTLGQRSWNQRRTEGRLPAQRNRLLFFLLSFPPPPSSSTFVEPSSMASSPSRSLSPKEFRKGRSESVAADLSVMKLMPSATGGCVDQHFSQRSSRPFLFLLHHGGWWTQLHRWLLGDWDRFEPRLGPRGEKVWRGRWGSVPLGSKSKW